MKKKILPKWHWRHVLSCVMYPTTVLGWRVKRHAIGLWNKAVRGFNTLRMTPRYTPKPTKKLKAPPIGARREWHMARYQSYKDDAGERMRQDVMHSFVYLRTLLDMYGIKIEGIVFTDPIKLYSALSLKDAAHTSNGILTATGNSDKVTTIPLVEYGYMNGFCIYTKPQQKEQDNELDCATLAPVQCGWKIYRV